MQHIVEDTFLWMQQCGGLVTCCAKAILADRNLTSEDFRVIECSSSEPVPDDRCFYFVTRLPMGVIGVTGCSVLQRSKERIPR